MFFFFAVPRNSLQDGLRQLVKSKGCVESCESHCCQFFQRFHGPLCMTSFNSTCLCNWSSPVHITWVMTICNFTSIQILSYCQVVNRPPRGHAQNREEFNFAWYALVVTRQHVDSAPIHANCSCRTLCSSLHRYKIPSFVRVDNFTTCYLADQHDVLLNLKVNLTLPFSEWPFAMCMHFL